MCDRLCLGVKVCLLHLRVREGPSIKKHSIPVRVGIYRAFQIYFNHFLLYVALQLDAKENEVHDCLDCLM